uniref:Uncharacterized protein n=1 Tax=viral metagenome TaxID=1070528 RepID=A0A6M3KTQ7_9ZZZZ
MTEADYIVLNEKIDSIQHNLDLHLKDTDKEIGDIQNLRMEVAANTEAIKELRKTLDRNADKVTNRFAQAIEPILEETQQLREKIDKKKFKILREPWNWRRLFRR